MATTGLAAKNRSIMDRLNTAAFANSTYRPAKSSTSRSTSAPSIAPRNIGITDLDGGRGGTPAPPAPKGTAAAARVINPGNAVATALQTKLGGGSVAAPNPNTRFAAAAQGTGTPYNDAAQGGFSNPGDPWTGFASRYAPVNADMLLSNPSQIFFDQMMAMGLQQPGGEMGMTQALAPYADIMPMLYSLFNSGRGNFGSREAQVNFIADFAKRMATPGGQDISLQGMLSQIYGNPDVAELYNTGNAAQNVQSLNDMLGTTASLSMNPMLQNMVQARNDRLAYEYLSQYAQGNTGGYADFVRQRGGPGAFYG